MVEIEVRRRNELIYIICIVLISVVSIYFRTHWMRNPMFIKAQQARAMTEKMIYSALVEQVETQLGRMGISDQRRMREMVDAGVREILDKDYARYERAVEEAVEQARRGSTLGWSRLYLYGADSYFYYYLTKQVLATGRLSDQQKGGKYFHPLQGTFGLWAGFNLHPYVGALWFRFLKFFGSNLDLLASLCFLPLVYCIVIVALFFFVCRPLGFSALAGSLGCICLTLAPIVIRRTYLGWYDTDPYNFIFPLAVSGLYMRGLKYERGHLWMGSVAGALSGLYALFWSGWPFISLFIFGSGVCLALLSFSRDKVIFKRIIKFESAYVIITLLVAMAGLTPTYFFESVRWGFAVVGKYTQTESNFWPNVFLTVGETRAVSVVELIKLTGNFVGYAFVAVGLFTGGVFYWRRKFEDFLSWFVLMLYFVPLIILSLRSQRFAVLLMVPFALLVAMSFDLIFKWIQEKNVVSELRRSVCTILLSSVIIISYVYTAEGFSTKLRSIMNDTWYSMLKDVRTMTPEDAVVISWWPPGHFISALAERRVVIDGGTQHLPEVYWIARALLAQDEHEALGLLRMIVGSGNEAMDYAQKLGYSTADAERLLSNLVVSNDPEAFMREKESLGSFEAMQLSLFCCKESSLPPTHIFIYDDLIKQNLALSLVARWDFEGAQLRNQKEAGALLKEEEKKNKFADWFSNPDEVLRYGDESPLLEQKGRWLYFKNGLSTHLDTKESIVLFPGGAEREARPASVFYLENGRLVEHVNSGQTLSVSALLIEKDGNWTSVLADRILIQSILFQLYYLDGKSLSFFKPVTRREDRATGLRLYLYEVDWSGLKRGA